MLEPMTVAQLTEILKKKGVHPSYQRLKVLEYLHQKPGHPTVDEIYEALFPEIPTLSRTTIYNTLHSFASHGLVHCLNLGGVETRYDIMLENHGHFKCDQCGSITNFQLDVDHIPVKGLKEHQIRQKNVIFNGLCPECIKKYPIIKGE